MDEIINWVSGRVWRRVEVKYGITVSRLGKKGNESGNEARDGTEASRNPSNRTQSLWFG